MNSVARAPWIDLIAALAVATLTRTLLFLVSVSHPDRFLTKDSFEYDALARHFSAAYVHAHGHLFDLSLVRPPGYPAFVDSVYTMAGRSITHVIVVQLALSLATVALTYIFAARLAGRTVATIAAFALAIDPISIVMSSNLTTETLFAFVWVLAAVLWVRGLERGELSSTASAGVLVGLSALIRPIALYLPVLQLPLTALLLAGSRVRRSLAIVALALGFAVPVSLWLARNAERTGVATISTIQSHNLLDYRAADALAIDTGVSRAEAVRRLEAEVARGVRPGQNPAQVSRVESSIAFHTLLHHPKGAVVSTLEGVGRVIFGPGRAELLRLVRGYTAPRGTFDRALEVAEAVVLFLSLALAAVGIVALVGQRRWLPLAATLPFVAYDVLLSAGAEGNARLRMPAMPFVAILAGIGAARALRRQIG